MKECVSAFRRAGVPATLNSGCLEITFDLGASDQVAHYDDQWRAQQSNGSNHGSCSASASSNAWVLLHLKGWDADPEVPVLYFMVSAGETWCTTLEQLQQVLPRVDVASVSPTVHPTLETRAWFVHPCYTREWFEAIGGFSTENYLLWFKGVALSQLGLAL